MISSIESKNTTQLVLVIESTQMQVTQIRDEKGFTLLHHAALKMRPENIKLLIEYARDKQLEDEDILLDWINSKTTKEKLTALHLASFKGCLQSCRTLVQFGADIRSENSFGMNMLHLAA